MRKLIVAGGRDFSDKELVIEHLNQFHKSYPIDEVVCGEARGADRLGKLWAQMSGVPVASFKPDWDTLGKRAGFVRNAEMADYATDLIAFWDGKSRGTGHMIDLARKRNLQVEVVMYDT